MKEYMLNRNRLADRANWLTDCYFTKTILFTFAIGMIFTSTTKHLKKLIKNIKQHFQKFFMFVHKPNNQDLSNDTPFSQIKSPVPAPLKYT